MPVTMKTMTKDYVVVLAGPANVNIQNRSAETNIHYYYGPDLTGINRDDGFVLKPGEKDPISIPVGENLYALHAPERTDITNVKLAIGPWDG